MHGYLSEEDGPRGHDKTGTDPDEDDYCERQLAGNSELEHSTYRQIPVERIATSEYSIHVHSRAAAALQVCPSG